MRVYIYPIVHSLEWNVPASLHKIDLYQVIINLFKIKFILFCHNADYFVNLHRQTKNDVSMKRITKFSISSEMVRLVEFQSRLVLVCNVLDSDPLYKGHYDDLFLKLSAVVGSIEDAISVFENE